MIEEPYWKESAHSLHRLLLRMPGVKPSDLADSGPRFFAAYKPPDESWDHAAEALRLSFASMTDPQFKSILETYLELYPS
jgi:hypothetical protein